MDFSPKFAMIASRSLTALAATLLLAVVGLYALRTIYADKVYPSVFVADVDVGGLTYPEAQSLLQTRAESILTTSISLTDGAQEWTATFGELGVSVDVPQSLDAAYEVGRENGARDRVSSTLELLNENRSLPLRFVVDEQRFGAWIDRIDSDLGRPGHDAYLSIENGKATVVPEVDGVVVDRALTHSILVSSLHSLQPYAGQLPTRDQKAAIHAADLEEARVQVSDALAVPIELSFGKRKWTVSGKDMGQFIVQIVEPDAAGAIKVSVAIDEETLTEYFAVLLTDEVNREPVNARVGWDLNKQKLLSVERSRNGYQLKPDELSRAVIASFWGDEKSVKIPALTIRPEIDSYNLDALGITTRLAVGDSNFDGSDYGRATNVAVGASLLNGTLVPPGGEFSFNYAIGEITTDLGYVEAGVVDGERIGKDIGGGICQVSTTVFRAAFYAGLPITEWNPHRYRLGFYEQDGWEPGLDASILQPEEDPFGGGDFRFSNPSDSWLLVESYTDGPRVIVIIYGPDLGYTVDVAGPYYDPTEYPPTDDIELTDEELPPGTIQQTEYELSGMDVSYQRTVFDKNGDLLWDRTFGTHFYPRGNVYKVSPDMKGKSPAKQDED